MANKINNYELTKLTKLTKLTNYITYPIRIERELWFTFKAIANMRNLRLYEAVKEAIIDYINKHKNSQQNITVKIIKNVQAKENLLQFIIEEEIKSLLKALLEAKQRDASGQYINQLKLKVIDNIKKHPNISEDLANQIKIVFQNLRD